MELSISVEVEIEIEIDYFSVKRRMSPVYAVVSVLIMWENLSIWACGRPSSPSILVVMQIRNCVSAATKDAREKVRVFIQIIFVLYSFGILHI